ncbi:MAG: hypothetical protein RLZZ627_1256 [Pseudomonadota bacterium]|jgi:hypothetical protein
MLIRLVLGDLKPIGSNAPFFDLLRSPRIDEKGLGRGEGRGGVLGSDAGKESTDQNKSISRLSDSIPPLG